MFELVKTAGLAHEVSEPSSYTAKNSTGNLEDSAKPSGLQALVDASMPLFDEELMVYLALKRQ